MDSKEFLRLVDNISRDRGLSKAQIIDDIEQALIQAARKRFNALGDFTLTIDRKTGEIRAYEDNQPVEMERLGRIVANVAKQVIIQRLREDERDVLYDEFIGRVGQIVSGTILRKERNTVIVQIGRAEAILPRDEQIPGEIYRPGATVRAYLLKVGKSGQRVRVVLTRTHVDFVRELFVSEVPEIADGLIEIKGIVREPGRRTKIAVAANDHRIDPVGSCVGMRGSRISKISDELGGEKIDIIPWAEDEAQFIINSLKPAQILRCSYDIFRDRARVVVTQDQLPLAIGKGGQNVRLSARLTRYRIDVMSEEQTQERRITGYQELQKLIETDALEDFTREVLLDNHLDCLAILAAQTVESMLGAIDDLHMTEEQVIALIAKANDLLDEEQEKQRDEFIAIRVTAEQEDEEAVDEEVVDEADESTAEGAEPSSSASSSEPDAVP